MIKKLFALGASVLALSALSVTAFAVSAYSNPAEAVAGLTGRTVESIVEEQQETGNTYCTIADEAGVLDEFKSEVLKMREESLDARVAAGTMTQEHRDEILAAIEANMETCDGTDRAMIGKNYGGGFGNNSDCLGTGAGRGFSGQGRRNGNSGMRYHNDSCTVIN